MNERTAVYRMFDAKGALLYIGISKSFGQRWSREAKTFAWWHEVQRQTVDWYPSREAAEAEEAAAIKAEHPRHNVVHARDPLVDASVDERLRAHPHLDPALRLVAVTGQRYSRTKATDPVGAHIATVIAALKAGKRPTDVASWSPFTAAHLRKLAREAGVPRGKKGSVPPGA